MIIIFVLFLISILPLVWWHKQSIIHPSYIRIEGLQYMNVISKKRIFLPNFEIHLKTNIMTDFTKGWGISNLLCNGRRRVKSDHYRPLQRGNGSQKTSNWALRNSWTFPCVAQSDCSILWYTKSLKGIDWYFRFNVRSYTLNAGSMCEYHFCVSEARCTPGPVRFQYSLIINVSWKESFDSYVWPLSFCLFFPFIFLHLLSILLGVHLVMT